jgi:3-oxoacyl-[acyl-carrier-protein] synthase-3
LPFVIIYTKPLFFSAMLNSKIVGTGHFVPPTIVTNDDLALRIDTTDAWIQERTGIKQRHWATSGTHTTSGLAYEASKIAIENAGITPNDIDFIVFATLSPDYYFPGPGVTLQKLLGIGEVGALDVRNQCSGFVYALAVADKFIKTGTYKNVLVVGAEIQSYGLDKTTRGRGVSVIFGDGAGAVVMQPTTDATQGVLSTHLHAQGEHAEQLYVRDPGMGRSELIYPELIAKEGIYPYMNGNFVFKHAVTRFPAVITEALVANGYTTADLDLLIPHQANLRITQYIQQTMQLPDSKVVSNIQNYGNTTAASIPIALSEARLQQRIKPNDLVCLAAFGSGFTWGSALIRW